MGRALNKLILGAGQSAQEVSKKQKGSEGGSKKSFSSRTRAFKRGKKKSARFPGGRPCKKNWVKGERGNSRGKMEGETEKEAAAWEKRTHPGTGELFDDQKSSSTLGGGKKRQTGRMAG